jgi:hypothetical protein
MPQPSFQNHHGIWLSIGYHGLNELFLGGHVMRRWMPALICLMFAGFATAQDNPPPREEEEKPIPPEKDPPIPEKAKPFPAKQALVYLEVMPDGSRRVHFLADTCLREGQLEALVCKAVTKEHESILSINIDGKMLHAALLAAGATPGSPAQFLVKDGEAIYKPAHGSKIKIELTYYLNGKLRQNVPAKELVMNNQTKKTLDSDWVFGGSRFVKLPDDPKGTQIYTANNGDFISVANFPDSMLDLPVRSSNVNDDRNWVANTKLIPSLRTKMLVTLIPVPEEKK